jgi:putative Ca2+/H+ antiporter (TMEM165/GDT1 family)
LVVRGNHLGLDGALMAVRWRGVTIFVVVVLAAVEVRRTFVLVWSTMICVTRDQFAHVARGVFIELLVAAEYEDSHVDRAEDGKLMRLLEQTTFALQKGN